MATLRNALYEAVRMYRPCVVRYTLYRQFEAVDVTDFEVMGKIMFVVPDNGELPIPMNDEAKKLLNNLVCESIGGENWKELVPYVGRDGKLSSTAEDEKTIPLFLRKGDRDRAEYPSKTVKNALLPKPKKKLRISKKK